MARAQTGSINMTFSALVQALKGGAGSGNFQHAGVPGHIGGSMPNLGRGDRVVLDLQRGSEQEQMNAKYIGIDVQGRHIFKPSGANYNLVYDPSWMSISSAGESKPTKRAESGRPEPKPTSDEQLGLHDNLDSMPKLEAFADTYGYWVTPQNKLLAAGDHLETLVGFKDPAKFGITKQEQQSIYGGEKTAGDAALSKVFDSGAIRVRVSDARLTNKRGVYIETGSVDNSNLKRVQKLIDNNQLPAGPEWSYFWEQPGGSKSVTASYEDILSSKYVVDRHGSIELKSYDWFIGLLESFHAR